MCPRTLVLANLRSTCIGHFCVLLKKCRKVHNSQCLKCIMDHENKFNADCVWKSSKCCDTYNCDKWWSFMKCLQITWHKRVFHTYMIVMVWTNTGLNTILQFSFCFNLLWPRLWRLWRSRRDASPPAAPMWAAYNSYRPPETINTENMVDFEVRIAILLIHWRSCTCAITERTIINRVMPNTDCLIGYKN